MAENSNPIRTFGDRLRALRGYAGLSRTDIERRYGISEASLKSWEVGTNKEVTKKSIDRLIEVFKELDIHCTSKWLTLGVGPSPFSPVSSKIDETLEESEDSELEKDPEKDWDREHFKETYPAHIHYRVNTDALQPWFFNQDLVAGHQLTPQEYSQKLGAFCVFRMSDNKIIVGRLVNGSTSEKFSILQDLFFEAPDALIVDAGFTHAYEILAVIKEPW